MTNALQTALEEIRTKGRHLPSAAQDMLAKSILEHVERFSESISMLNLASSTMDKDWDNELDASYDNYDKNHAS